MGGSEVAPVDDSQIPALLDPYRDLSLHRYDYPIFLNGAEANNTARSLTEIVDDLLAEVADDSDDGARLKRQVYQLESTIKNLAEQTPGEPLSELWRQASDQLLSRASLTDEKKELLRQNLSRAREALQLEGNLIPCGTETPRRAFTTLMAAHWQDTCSGWREELESLIHQMQDILSVDFNRSPQAKSANHLRESVGPRTGDEIDSEAMSSILSDSELDAPIAPDRRDRVQETLSTLLEIQPVFDVGRTDTKMPFRVDDVTDDCSSAVEQYEKRMGMMTTFFKAARIARLDIDNRYRQAMHDPFFSSFDGSYLTDEELALCPPVLLHLKTRALTNAAELLYILNSHMPIKILLQVDDICSAGDSGSSVMVDWPVRLANMAVALSHVYVLQAPVSHLPRHRSSFMRGLGHQGPSLFSVFSGMADTWDGLSTYLGAATATESRCFPVFTFDPSLGTTLAERIHILDNPQSDQDWPTEHFAYRTSDGSQAAIDLALTPADFLFCDRRLAAHFWNVPPEQWHENMVPLDSYLQLDEDGVDDKVPYLLTVDGMGRLGRVVMTRPVVMSALMCRSFWRHLQESGGVNNSFAIDLAAKEKERLTEEKRCEVEEIEKNYVAQIDQDIGELTKEIIQRIANQLMTEGGNGSQTLLQPMIAPADTTAVSETVAPAPATEEAVEEAQEEEEEVAVFDDPYIDTPLCTTCNECTQLNGQMFAYNANKQAYIKDPTAGSYKDLVRAAELCPVHIIHPGKPKNPDEEGLEALIERAAPFS
jgi:ferredoxin